MVFPLSVFQNIPYPAGSQAAAPCKLHHGGTGGHGCRHAVEVFADGRIAQMPPCPVAFGDVVARIVQVQEDAVLQPFGGLDAFIRRHGEDWNAGQAARLPSIPSNAGQGLGIYDKLHGFPNGAALSEHLTAAAAKQHGTIGRAFIAILQNDPAALQTAKERQNAFMAALPELNGQARTVALRFALAAAALETAALHGLIPLPIRAALRASKRVSRDRPALSSLSRSSGLNCPVNAALHNRASLP